MMTHSSKEPNRSFLSVVADEPAEADDHLNLMRGNNKIAWFEEMT